MKRSNAKKSKPDSASKPKPVGVVIETPKGSRNKLKYDPAQRMYKLSKVMPEGMVFPYDFGSYLARKQKMGIRSTSWSLRMIPSFQGVWWIACWPE